MNQIINFCKQDLAILRIWRKNDLKNQTTIHCNLRNRPNIWEIQLSEENMLNTDPKQKIGHLKSVIDDLKQEYSFWLVFFILTIYLAVISIFALALLKPIFLFLLPPLFYLRVKRSIGFQEYSAIRLTIPIILFSIFLILFAILTGGSSSLFYVLGIALGAGLVWLAGSRTLFEKREDRLYYSSPTWIQTVVLIVYFVRVLYRLYSQYGISRTSEELENPIRFFSDPFTTSTVTLLFTYNILYPLYILTNESRRKSDMQHF